MSKTRQLIKQALQEVREEEPEYLSMIEQKLLDALCLLDRRGE